MPYQITCTTKTEYNGRVTERTVRVTVSGMEITLATEDEARKIRNILAPDQRPYILSQGELDRPNYTVIEGGLSEWVKPLAEVIRLLGEQDYYNADAVAGNL